MNHESQKHRIERCVKEVEDNPQSATAYYNLGLAYTVSGRVKAAEEAYVQAVELDPSVLPPLTLAEALREPADLVEHRLLPPRVQQHGHAPFRCHGYGRLVRRVVVLGHRSPNMSATA